MALTYLNSGDNAPGDRGDARQSRVNFVIVRLDERIAALRPEVECGLHEELQTTLRILRDAQALVSELCLFLNDNWQAQSFLPLTRIFYSI